MQRIHLNEIQINKDGQLVSFDMYGAQEKDILREIEIARNQIAILRANIQGLMRVSDNALYNSLSDIRKYRDEALACERQVDKLYQKWVKDYNTELEELKELRVLVLKYVNDAQAIIDNEHSRLNKLEKNVNNLLKRVAILESYHSGDIPPSPGSLYTIIYHSAYDGKNTPTQQSVALSKKLRIESMNGDATHIFEGWATSPNGEKVYDGGKEYDNGLPNAEAGKEYHLYAIWWEKVVNQDLPKQSPIALHRSGIGSASYAIQPKDSLVIAYKNYHEIIKKYSAVKFKYQIDKIEAEGVLYQEFSLNFYNYNIDEPQTRGFYYSPISIFDSRINPPGVPSWSQWQTVEYTFDNNVYEKCPIPTNVNNQNYVGGIGFGISTGRDSSTFNLDFYIEDNCAYLRFKDSEEE